VILLPFPQKFIRQRVGVILENTAKILNGIIGKRPQLQVIIKPIFLEV